MTLHAPSLVRLLPLTRPTAQHLAQAFPGPIKGDLVAALHELEVRHLRNAPEEDVPHLERPSERIVFRVEGLWTKPGRLFAALFTHPEFDQLYLKYRPFDYLPCTISFTDAGIVLEGRPAHWQSKDDFKPWRVELPFVDESVKAVDKRNRPLLLDPDHPQDPDFIRESLVQLERVFAQQPHDLYWDDHRSWCRPRFVNEWGEVGFTELLSGVWLAVQNDADEALLVCAADRFQPHIDVPEDAIFLQTPSTVALRITNYARKRREALWEVALGTYEGNPAYRELESTASFLRTLISDRRTSRLQADALLQPVVPRPFLCQRYL